MIPNPAGYPAWQNWALAVTRVLTPFITKAESTFYRQGQIPRVAVFAVANMPSADDLGRIIYVSDETGGAVLAFSDGSDWRRVTDRAVVS
jgi:hypothetical protein